MSDATRILTAIEQDDAKAAHALGLSQATAKGWWAYARAGLLETIQTGNR